MLGRRKKLHKGTKMNKLQIYISAALTVLVLALCVVIVFDAVPSVEGLSGQEALDRLEKKGFTVETEYQFAEIEEGNAVDTEPGAHHLRVRRSTVTLLLSKGSNVIPSFIGMSNEQTAQALSTLGVSVQTEVRWIAADAQGVQAAVVMQKPEPGTVMSDGDKVLLYQTLPSGNTAANVLSRGALVQQGEWLYYRRDDDGGKLYKRDVVTGSEQKLTEDCVGSINVNGDWIYYENYCNGHSLYKVKTDGTERTQVIADACEYLILEGAWLYYRNNSEGGRLYRIHTDGTERTKLCDDVVSNINVSDERVFYRTDDLETDLTVTCELNQGQREVISGEEQWAFLNIHDGYLYYQNVTDGRSIYRRPIEGGSSEKLNNDISAYINVAGDWVYYQSISFNNGIYKMRLDGSERKKVWEKPSAYINVSGDYLLFQAVGEDALWYLLSLDSKEAELISEVPVKEEETESGASSSDAAQPEDDGADIAAP